MSDMPPKLHLASGSPRRREILTALGLDFTHAAVDLDERRLEREPPEEMVVRLAAAKAAAAKGAGRVAGRVVIGADTAVVLGSRVLGKPRSEDDALAMLAALSGKAHQVMTGVAVVSAGGTATALSRSEVRFRDIDPAEAAEYWQSGEPRDKAGAYGIQGKGGIFVAGLRGSYSNVVGLPVFETAELLSAAGIDVLRGVRT